MTKPSYEQVIVSVQYTVEWLISSVTPYCRVRQLILTYFCFLRNNSTEIFPNLYLITDVEALLNTAKPSLFKFPNDSSAEPHCWCR